ncbi:MAG: translocation/assembly module TamB domain-containing protein [bacterium]
MKKVFAGFVTILFLGAIVALFIVQRSDRFQKFCSHTILSYLKKAWDADICVKKSFVSLFSKTILFEKGTVIPHEKDCSWSFDQAHVRVSLFDLIFKDRVALYLSFRDVKAKTAYSSESFDIANHFSQIFATKEFSGGKEFAAQSIHVHNTIFEAKIQNKNISIFIDGDFAIRKDKKVEKPSQWRGYLHMAKGEVFLNGKQLIANLAGINEFCKASCDTTWTATIKNSFMYPFYNKNSYSLSGSWNDTDHSIQVKGNCIDMTVSQQKKNINVSGVLPAELINHMYLTMTDSFVGQTQSVQGLCSVNVDFQKNKKGLVIQAKASGKNLQYKDFSLSDWGIDNVRILQDKVSGSFSACYTPNSRFKGNFTWDLNTGKQDFVLYNDSEIEFVKNADQVENSAWFVRSKGIYIRGTRRKDFFTGIYKIMLSRTISHEQVPLQGTFCLQDKDIIFDGTGLNGIYNAVVSLQDQPYVKKLAFNRDQKCLISMKADNDAIIKGFVYFPLIQSLLSQNIQRMILGSNSYIGLSINQNFWKEITGSLWLHKGKLYLPESRNLVKQMAIDFSLFPKEKKLILKDPKVYFGQGILESDRIAVLLDDNYGLGALYAPVKFEQLFLNWKNDFYVFASGNFVFSKQPQGILHIEGDVLLNKSLLKNNPLSDDVKSFVDFPLDFVNYRENGFNLTLRVRSEKPIKVKTSSIDTKAKLNFFVEFLNNDEAPKVEGTIELEGGYLQILDNKLFIETGNVQFVPSQINDPLISLVAKNKIGRHLISLQATGSLQKPKIFLESSPTLSEEQIFGVLLAGSEHASLQASLPVLVMQNLHVLLFGNKKVAPRASAFLEKLIRPLKYVHITPNFTDQSGRGGIKGVVSVDLGEQIHAQVQKNFNLQDDLAFQVEYLLSDDVNIKAVKDQRGELGSEVEVRFKF